MDLGQGNTEQLKMNEAKRSFIEVKTHPDPRSTQKAKKQQTTNITKVTFNIKAKECQQ